MAFELLNEPYSQLDTAWNDLSAAAIQAVRATNPRRLLVVDAVYWADPSKLSVLTLPLFDSTANTWVTQIVDALLPP